MSILKRAKSILESNINALLDKCEDPSKMVDQLLRDAIKDLAEVKKETAEVMASERNAERSYNAIKKSVDEYEMYAMRAVQALNDEDATTFLSKAEALKPELQNTYNTYIVAKQNADTMRNLHDKLVSDIEAMEARKNTIKSTIAVAKAQEKINKMGGTNAENIASRFSDYEEKSQRMLDIAQATAELNQSPVDEAEELKTKYINSPSQSVQDKLAELKAKANLG